ncbi:unnamed protein product, partial [marine sediment metagenome]
LAEETPLWYAYKPAGPEIDTLQSNRIAFRKGGYRTPWDVIRALETLRHMSAEDYKREIETLKAADKKAVKYGKGRRPKPKEGEEK